MAPYVVIDGQICRIKQLRRRNKIIPLCNFDARIKKVIRHDDGEVFFRIWLKTADDQFCETRTVSKRKFECDIITCFLGAFGPRAIVEPCVGAGKHLPLAIRYLSHVSE